MCLFITPSFLNADPDPVYNNKNGHYYELIQTFLSWEDANAAARSMEYKGYPGHLATITSQEENDFIYANFGNYENYWFWLGGQQERDGSEPAGGWQWVTGEIWSFTNWNSGEPNNGGGENENSLEFLPTGFWNDFIGSSEQFYIVEYDVPLKSDPEPEQEPEVWVRDHEMTCYQVWINEDDNFEFVFWWEYANNNWVKIYDMAGNEVFSIDIPYGAANFITGLPDGIYTVKTFHNGFETPIQEFLIGKP